MCHPDDLPALRAMLKQAITCISTLTAPVRVRLKAASGDWRPVEMVGSGVRLGDEAPHTCCVGYSPSLVPNRTARVWRPPYGGRPDPVDDQRAGTAQPAGQAGIDIELTAAAASAGPIRSFGLVGRW